MENRSVREIREGGKLPTLFSSPLIKIRVFNWSKLIFYLFYFSFVFIYFYSFLFILALWLFSSLLFYQESITCQHINDLPFHHIYI